MTRDPSWGALLEPRLALSAAVVLLAIVAPAMSYFVTATVLPSVIADIGGLALYAWASTAYAVASILGSAGTAVLVRRHGTRAALLLAALAFIAGTSVCAMAPSMPVLIVGRTVQGLGGGMLFAAAHGVVREMFPAALWARMLAAISASWGVAATGGPALGGVFAGLGMWRGAFWAMVPLAAATAVMTWRLLPPGTRATARPAAVPFGRLALVCTGVLCVASVANIPGVTIRFALVAAAIATVALMLRLDAAAEHPLFPSGMLSLRGQVGKSFWILFGMAMSTTPGSVYIPLLLQVLHGVAPATAGYFYAAQSLAWSIVTVLAARFQGDRVRIAVVLGPCTTAAGFAVLATSIVSGPVIVIAGGLVLVGAGIGTCWAHVGSILLASVRREEAAVAGSLIPTAQTFAVALGAALSGIIANAAGLARDASVPAAGLAAVWLFGAFLGPPLGALAIATRLRPPTR